MPSLSSAPQSSLLFFIALLCRGAFLSQPLVCFSPERGRKLAEFKTAWGQQVIKKVPVRKHWKDNRWFFPQQAGDLPGSLLKGDTMLCECRGRQHGVLEEEYITGYMETASGSKLLWNEQQSPGGYWDKPSQMLFPFLPTSGHFPSTHCREQDGRAGEFGTCSQSPEPAFEQHSQQQIFCFQEIL